MKKRRLTTRAVRRVVLLAGVFLLIGLAAGPARSAEEIDPDADKILRSMSNYLGGLSAFSMNADINNEFVNLDGQKLQLSSFSTILIERPGAFLVTRKGMFADTVFIFDGKTVTIYGRKLNVYAQFDCSGSIDDAIWTVEHEMGLNAPGADLLFTDPYSILSSGVVEANYIGAAYVNGVECHHLAFREDKTDWQLWVKTGDEPLPMKYVITSKWVTGAPQYTVCLRDWNTKPRIDPNRFKFTVPEGAQKLENIPVNELGELILKKEDL